MLMGGQWSEPFREWNILCDPEAAAMVFCSGADLSMVGLDVTLHCVLSDEQVQNFHDSPHAGACFLGRLVTLWGHAVTLHGSLTVLTLFSDVVSFEPKRLEVVLCGDARAHTRAIEGEPNCQVAVAVDAERAKTLFLERVLR